MNIISINSGIIGSTGNIMIGIMKLASKNQEVAISFPMHRNLSKIKFEMDCFRICSFVHHRISFHLYKILGFDGVNNYFQTKKLCKYILKNNVKILHLHNIHTSFLDYGVLFDFIKSNNIKVVWTLHDCWAFTGHCPYFTMVGCDRWETGCYKCPQYKEYPQSYFDNSKKMYKLKKKWFTGVENMTLVTPSRWLAVLVGQSFLKDYPVKVINNGIDLSVFKPTESDFRGKYNISIDKYILLGVAFGWGKRKGLDVFIELSKRLTDKYQIVLVGTDDKTDKRLPSNIISIHRTQNQTELAEIYTAADLFVNPTREENYPTVNMESIACGTPVVTFRTGGSPEILDETCGSIVDCDDIDALESEIMRISEEIPYTKDACLRRAKSFDMNERFKEYIDLYKEMDYVEE